MELRSRHWLLGLGVAAAVHIGLAVLLFYESDDGARAVGLGGIEVALGPAGGSPGVAGAAVEPELPEVETVAAPEASVVEPELETAELEVPEVAEQIPEPVEEVRAREVKPSPSKPKLKPKPKPVAKPKPPTPVQPERQAEVARTASPAPSGAGGRAGTEQKKEAGSGDATPGGGAPGATADYFAHLRAWLERHKRYPRRAQLRRQEGTVLLRFVMDREGQVLSYRVERSSGYRLLDDEVEEMIERASPLPAMPAEMQQAQLELVVPVSFFLR